MTSIVWYGAVFLQFNNLIKCTTLLLLHICIKEKWIIHPLLPPFGFIGCTFIMSIRIMLVILPQPFGRNPGSLLREMSQNCPIHT